MKTLKLSNIARNFTLLAAGAFMATLVVVPFTTSADDDDDSIIRVRETPSTFVIEASNGIDSRFTLVENGGNMVLALVEEAPQILVDEFDDDD